MLIDSREMGLRFGCYGVMTWDGLIMSGHIVGVQSHLAHGASSEHTRAWSTAFVCYSTQATCPAEVVLTNIRDLRGSTHR